jgi:pentatricopeptide repeat domain-containing protein 1
MSVEELVRVCSTLPPDGSAVAAVSAAMAYLDSRATAALMKELAKTQQLARAMEIFDWLKSLPAEHELYGLCDVYTFTTAISLMGPSQQLRRALELIGEMRARGLQCNVHTYSALMNVCIKVREEGVCRVGFGVGPARIHAPSHPAINCPATTH